MIDIDLIRDDIDSVANNLSRRGVTREEIEKLAAVDANWRGLTQEVENLRANENNLNKEISAAAKGDRQKLIDSMKLISSEIKTKEADLQNLHEERQILWKKLPNITSADVPEGPDETSNVILREVGERSSYDFEPRPHWDLGESLGIIDNTQAAEVTGSRFTYLKGEAAMLQFALIQFVLSYVTDEKKLESIIKDAGLKVPVIPFTPVIPPVFIRPEVLERMGRLEPKEDRYYVESDDLYLVGSAEHTLGPMHMDQSIPESVFPLRYIGYSTSFRRESGSHGKDVRGILRLHQFDKLEMESFTLADQSAQEQELFVAIQERLMQDLELPYRVVLLSTGEMGDPDARQVDIETWMPGQDAYRETHTSDLMTDYQARRLQTRVVRENGERELVHMNDGTAIAVGRVLIALMENHQLADGSIAIPKSLHPYLSFNKIASRS